MLKLTSLLLTSAILAACASKPPDSGRSRGTTQVVSAIQVVLDERPNGTVEISRTERGTKPVITEQDKRNASSSVVAMRRLLSDGLVNSLPRLAQPYGLNIAGPGKGIPTLRLEVVWSEMQCTLIHCQTYLRIRGDLFGSDEAHLWYFIKEFRTYLPTTPATPAAFDAFAKDVLDSMRRDGIIAQKVGA